MVNLDYLITFRELSRLGSFSAVARQLGISQPAVSFQIQKLESSLNTVLIDRSQKKPRLTQSGHRLLAYTDQLIDDYTRLQGELEKIRTDVTGEINIATSTVPGESMVPALLGRFLASHQDVTAQVDIMDSLAVIDSISHGDYRIGFCGIAPPDNEGLTGFKIASDSIVLIGSPGHPLSGLTEIDLEDLKSHYFICRGVTSGTQQSVKQALSDRGFDIQNLNIRAVLSNTEAVISAVESGSGLAFVSSIGARKHLKTGSVIQLQIKEFKITRDFFCIYYPASQGSKLYSEFISLVRSTSAQPDWLY
jgi:DNA-binding transcriptional LysR family regulator